VHKLLHFKISFIQNQICRYWATHTKLSTTFLSRWT